ncbi:MAG: hypothetical protein IJN31_02320 [Peptococcaceae bacterium]|nr:hypothetical protein [Peptococcaceae bacterium]
MNTLKKIPQRNTWLIRLIAIIFSFALTLLFPAQAVFATGNAFVELEGDFSEQQPTDGVLSEQQPTESPWDTPSGFLGTLAGTTASQWTARMSARFWDIYITIRNNIAFPILALSYASCGFKILSAAYLSKSEFTHDAIKKQFLTSTCAFFLLISLPAVMTYVKNLVKATGWQPPT